jgi:hypothetical protein
MATTPRDLPSVSQTVEPAVRDPLVRAIEEVQRLLGYRGDPQDAAITLRKAKAIGLVDSQGRALVGDVTYNNTYPVVDGGGGGGVPEEPDLAPPPTPTGFGGEPGFSFVNLTWDAAVYNQGHGPGQTNVYGVQRALPTALPAPVFGDAQIVHTVFGANNITSIPSELNTRWHLWIKFQTADGVESVSPAGDPLGGSNGLVLETAQDVGQLLDVLSGQITESELFADLADRIDLTDLITAPDTTAGSVAARIKVETDARVAAIGAEASARATALTNEATARTTAINAEATARAAAISTEATTRANAITAEQTARTTAINALAASTALDLGDAVTDVTAAFTSADASTLASAQSYTYSQAYIDGATAATLSTVRAEFAAADTATLASAQSYTFSQATITSSIASALTTVRAEFAAADVTTLSAAESYTYARSTIDAADASVLSTVRAEFAAADASTLTSAQSYVQGYAYSFAGANDAIADAVEVVDARLNVGGNVYSSIVTAQSTASAKSANFVQSSAPTNPSNGLALRTGDLWIDTANGNKVMRWNGSAWVAADDTRIGAAASNITLLQSAVGNKNKVFRQSAEPLSTAGYTLAVGDLWVDLGSTNLFLQSENFGGTSWLKAGTVFDTDLILAPDGTTTADTMKPTTPTGTIQRLVYQKHTTSTTGTFTFSVMVKRGTVAANGVALYITDQTGTPNVRANFNLFTLVAPTPSVTTWVSGGAVVQVMADDWVRISLTATSNTAHTEVRAYIYLGSYTSLPDTTGTIHLWGAQLERASAMGRYIKTDTASVVTSGNNQTYAWDGTKWVAADDARINATKALLLNEYSTTVDMDQAIADASLALTTSFETADDLITADLSTNYYTRSAADSAIAASTDILSAQIRGAYTGADINAVSTGLLYQERVARVAQDNALTEQITQLTAGSGEQFDYSTIYYFDAGIEGWSASGGAVALTATAGWLKLVATSGSVANQYVQSPDNLVDVPGAKYTQVRARIKKFGTPTWEGKVYFTTTVDNTYTEGKSLTLAEPAFDEFGISVVTWDMPATWTSATIRRIRLDLADPTTTANYFEIDWVAIGRPSPGASSAQLTAEQLARTSADDAQTTARETLATQVRGSYTGNVLASAGGLIASERDARATADTAEVTARQSLSAKVTGANDPSGLTLATLSSGLLYDERTARVTSDTAQVLRLDTLEATVYNPTTGVTATSSALDSVELLVNNATTGVAATATKVAALEAEIDDPVNGLAATAGALDTLEATVSNGTTGLAATVTRVGSLEATVNNGTTGVAATATALDVVELLVNNATTGVSATATKVSALEATVNNATTGVAATANALDVVELAVNNGTTGLSAQATRVTTLESKVNTPTSLNNPTYALLTGSYSTTANTNTAIASAVDAVVSNLNSPTGVYTSIVNTKATAESKSATFVQGTAPTATKLNDLWVDTANGNLLKRWNGSAWVVADDTRIGTTATNVTTLQSTARAGNTGSLLPSTFTDGTLHWSNTRDGFPDVIGTAAGTLVTNDADFGSCLDVNNLAAIGASLMAKGAAPAVPGRVYRITSRFKVTGGDGSAGLGLVMSGQTATFSNAGTLLSTAVTCTTGVVTELTMLVASATGTDGRLAWSAGTKYLRPGLRLNTAETGLTLRVQYIKIEDITDERLLTAAVQAEALTRADETGDLFGQYTVKIDLNGYVSGYGLASTAPAGGALPSSAFAVRADQFYIAPPTDYSQESAPAGLNATTDVGKLWFRLSTKVTTTWNGTSWQPFANNLPFIVRTTTTTEGGLSVPAGTYINAAYIVNLTAMYARIQSLVADTVTATVISATQITGGTMRVGSFIQSSNYTSGDAGLGWRINEDGTAYLQAAYIRGTLTASQINGNGLSIRTPGGTVILDASGTGSMAWSVVSDTPTGLNRLGLGTMHTGGFGNVRFTINTTTGGAANDGEIRVQGTAFYHPDGTKRTIVNDTSINTPYEGSITKSPFFLVYSQTSPASRFGGASWGSNLNFFPATYNVTTNTWQAIDNSNVAYTFVPAVTDCAVAICNKTSTSGGIDSLSSLIGVNTNLPEDGATVGAPAGTTVGGVLADDIATTHAAVTDLTTGLNSRLRNNANDVLGGIISVNVVSAPAGFRAGTLNWNTAGVRTSGSGVAMTPLGLVAYAGATPTFVLDATTGNATFAGELDAATGTFAGALSAATGEFNGALKVGTNPQRTTGGMTGTGAVFNAGGTFAIGNATNNLSFDNTTLTLNGDLVATGNIQTSAVSTIKIGANAVTIPAGATGTLGAFTTETTLCATAAVDTDGQPLYVSFFASVTVTAGTSSTATATLEVDNVPVLSKTVSFGTGGGTMEFTEPYYDASPGSAGQVIRLRVSRSGGTSANARGTIFAVGLKR